MKTSEAQRERQRKYYQENRDARLAYRKRRYQENKTEILQKDKLYRESLPEEEKIARRKRTAKTTKEWASKNREYVRLWKKEWYEQRGGREKTKTWAASRKEVKNSRERERLRKDPTYRVLASARSRIRYALKGNRKVVATETLLGGSAEEARRHIESLFSAGMSWENYGEWHIDHIVPFAVIDVANPEELKKVCHYTNLQPLWKLENLKKGKKIRG